MYLLISFSLAQRKKIKASVALMKVFPNELENQKDFDSFTEWLQTFELYRGKQGEEGFQDEARVVGQFKVSHIDILFSSNHNLQKISSGL